MPPTSTTIKRMSNTSEQATNQLRRGPWTLEEDTLLMHYIANHGEGHWNTIAKSAGLKRTGKSCRLRWLNYLKPDIKRGNLSPQEQLLILELHSKLGNRWSKIAQHLPGRTDNEIKNYWRTRVQKQARQLNIESNSKKFVEAVRCFWMPRLLQKMEQTSSDSSTSSLTNLSNHQNYSAPSLSINSPVPYDMSPSSSKLVQSSIDNSNEYISCITCPSSTISTDCTMVSQIPQISEFPKSPCNLDFGEATVYNDFVMDESYYVNNFSYDMEGGQLNLDHNSALGNFGNSQFDYQMEASDNWVLGDMTDTLWNL